MPTAPHTLPRIHCQSMPLPGGPACGPRLWGACLSGVKDHHPRRRAGRGRKIARSTAIPPASNISSSSSAAAFAGFSGGLRGSGFSFGFFVSSAIVLQASRADHRGSKDETYHRARGSTTGGTIARERRTLPHQGANGALKDFHVDWLHQVTVGPERLRILQRGRIGLTGHDQNGHAR